jgi:hypothetical protein
MQLVLLFRREECHPSVEVNHESSPRKSETEAENEDA